MAENRKSRTDFATDSEWYTYQVTHPEEFKEKEENEKKEKVEHIKETLLCNKCGLVIDETAKGFEKAFKGKIKRDENGAITNCPHCNASRKNLQKITKKKVEEIKEKKKKKEQKEKNRQTKIATQNIKDDLMDLMEDLRQRVLNDEISVKRFVIIFMNLSKNIVDRYTKDVELDIDWLDYRKSMLDACQLVIDNYDFKEETTKIMEEFDSNIEEDKLYLAEFEYYINDDKYSIASYEYEERIKEYEEKTQNIFEKEKLRELEEKYQERRKILEEKANEREKRRIERAIS